MDTLILILLALAVLALVGAFAVAFGVESRDGFRDAKARASGRAPRDVA